MLSRELDCEDGINPRWEATLLQLRTEPMTKFMHADSALSSDSWNNCGKALRRHTAFLLPCTSPEFLQCVDVVTTQSTRSELNHPIHAVMN